MNFEERRREADRVDESEIFPNRHVLVSMVGREIEEKVPLKPLTLTPPAKIVDNCLPLGFHWQFFYVRVPNIISKLKNKKLPFRTRCLSSFIFSNGRSTMREQTTWWHRSRKSAQHVFMFPKNQYKKISPDAVQYYGLHVFYSNYSYFKPSCTVQMKILTIKWYIL